MNEIIRRPLKRLPRRQRVPVIFCGGHHAGWAALSAFVEPWNWCYQNCEVVCVIPDRKDIPSAKGSLWEYDDSKWRIKMVPQLAKRHGIPIRKLELWPGTVFNEKLMELIAQTRARAILSCTFRGIFRKQVIDSVDGRAFNIHPTGIAVEKSGQPQLIWPQPLFEGKEAVDRMLKMNRKFRAGKSDTDCQGMEWIIHQIYPPPEIDRGRFLGASEFPIPLPHEEQEGRDRRKQYNGVQSHCAQGIAALLHRFGPHLFRDEAPPWSDPRAIPGLPANFRFPVNSFR